MEQIVADLQQVFTSESDEHPDFTLEMVISTLEWETLDEGPVHPDFHDIISYWLNMSRQNRRDMARRVHIWRMETDPENPDKP